jgi:hypothetical protein
MSNRLSRDTEDAAKVLTALRDKFHPLEALPEKLRAADDLRTKLINVATGVRKWSVKAAHDDTLVTLQGAGTVHIRTDPKTAQIQVSLDGASWLSALLEYDPVNHEWVGSELDMDIVLPAGEWRPHKAALVALCDQLVQLLGDAQTESLPG